MVISIGDFGDAFVLFDEQMREAEENVKEMIKALNQEDAKQKPNPKNHWWKRENQYGKH